MNRIQQEKEAIAHAGTEKDNQIKNLMASNLDLQNQIA